MVGTKPRETYDILKSEGGLADYGAYSNDVPYGETPRRIEGQEYLANGLGDGGVHGPLNNRNVAESPEAPTAWPESPAARLNPADNPAEYRAAVRKLQTATTRANNAAQRRADLEAEVARAQRVVDSHQNAVSKITERRSQRQTEAENALAELTPEAQQARRDAAFSHVYHQVQPEALELGREELTKIGVPEEDAKDIMSRIAEFENEAGASRVAAGLFEGDVDIHGRLTKTIGSFRIDHPLDPANKYLSHSFVESPDMMNVYNGNVTTDGNGDVVVSLPDYFEALNRDFRYQLTVIGQFAQAIISKEIENNRFGIKTDKPNVKVSWQVTGIRKDAYAAAHPIVVEEVKPVAERGKYLNPVELGQPQVLAIGGGSTAKATTQ